MKNVTALLAVAAIMVIEASPVRADQAQQEAIKLTQLGKAALDRGELDIALAHFQSSYKLYPSPNTRFNMALVYEKMGLASAPDAIRAYRDFLAASDTRPNHRAHAQRRIVELERRLGRIHVTCNAEGAEVYVDGKEVGETPLTDVLYVVPGEHQLTITSSGFVPFVKTINVGAGMVDRTQVVLERPPTDIPILLDQPAVPSTDTAARPGRTLRIGGLVLGATGIVMVATGAYFGISAMQDGNTLDELNSTGGQWNPTYAEIEDRARGRATTATLLISTGAVAMSTGAVLYYFGYKQGRPAKSVTVALAPGGLAAHWSIDF